jgi:hypothetical protein
MTRTLRPIILALVLLAVCIPLASAWTVESYTINPSGPLPQNAPVTISFSVDFPADASEMTFPAGSDLILTTGLSKPAWTYTITTGDGGSSTTPAVYNQTLDLNSLLLSYKGHGSEVMSVTLAGTAPVAAVPANITVLDVHEVDKDGNCCHRFCIHPGCGYLGCCLDNRHTPADNRTAEDRAADRVMGPDRRDVQEPVRDFVLIFF